VRFVSEEPNQDIITCSWRLGQSEECDVIFRARPEVEFLGLGKNGEFVSNLCLLHLIVVFVVYFLVFFLEILYNFPHLKSNIFASNAFYFHFSSITLLIQYSNSNVCIFVTGSKEKPNKPND